MFPRAKYKEDLTLDDIKDAVGSKKYDGGMFFAIVKKNGALRFVSRRQSVKGHYPDRTSQLPQFHDIRLPEHAGAVIGLELIHTGHKKEAPESHPMVSGILNSLPPRAISTQHLEGPVRAVLHDVIKPKLATYKEKINFLKDVETKAGKPDVFFTPEFTFGHDAIRKLIDKTRDEGHEGVIVTSLSEPEAQNPRLKVKHRQTWNLKVSGIREAIDKYGKPKKMMGALELKDATGRHVGDVGTGFSHPLRIEIWNNKRKWMDKPIQVTGVTPVREKMKAKMMVYNGLADGEIDTIP